MAGSVPAINWKTKTLSVLSLYNPPFSSSFYSLHSKPILFPSLRCYSSFQILRMEIQNNSSSPEVKEPSPKIPKLQKNGNGQASDSFFRVKKLSDKAILPTRGSLLSAGYDLSSATDTKVPARGKALIPTDLSIAVPEGTYARIAPRSGLAWKHSIDVGAGVIDADYRGPVGVILFNHSDVDFECCFV
eukprot:XP_015573206.2 LOW QUALITY PROTEIN: deoxyuridine 5'-triphosphate nucleotidohydrolase [Ricinus communis]